MPTDAWNEANKQYKKLVRRWTFILIGGIASIILATFGLLWLVTEKF